MDTRTVDPFLRQGADFIAQRIVPTRAGNDGDAMTSGSSDGVSLVDFDRRNL